MNFRATRILAAALLASSCGLAIGATATANFTVTATVAANCTVSTSAAGIPFGTYAAGGGAKTGTLNILVTCTNGTPYTIGLSDGSGGGTALGMRTMASAATAADKLEYNLYLDTGYLVKWNDPLANLPGTNNASGTGTGMLAGGTLYPVYGQLPDSANNRLAKVHADYIDNIAVNVYY
jgi:spore coat protein U-like protein